MRTHISQYLRARHEPARVTRQKHGQSVQLVRPAQPAHRRHGAPVLLLPFEQGFAVQRRVHVSRRDGVDADGVGGPFRGEGFGELGDGCFGGAGREVGVSVFVSLVGWECEWEGE